MTKVIIIASIIALLASCTEKIGNSRTEIFNSDGKHIGDSIFVDGNLTKIDFLDSSLILDSIIFTWWENKNIKSKYAFKEGKKVFENVDFYENGKMKTYSFVDEQNPNFYYERNYNLDGSFLKERGKLFFQGYIEGLDFGKLEVKQNTDVRISIFYPNPPDCKTFLYVMLENGEKGDVFHENEIINFLKKVSVGNTKMPPRNKIWTEIDIWLEMYYNGDTSEYHKPFFYKIVS